MSSQTELPWPMPVHGDPLCCPECGQLINNVNFHSLFCIFTYVDPDDEHECEVLIHNDSPECIIYRIEELDHPLLKHVDIIHHCRDSMLVPN